jgi:prophage regulatory protein
LSIDKLPIVLSIGKSRVASMTDDDADLDLVGSAEIAEMLGVSKQRVNQMAADPNYPFPRPVAQLRAGRVWRRSDIMDWARQHRRELRG